MIRYDMTYLTAIGLTPGGSSTNLHANITQNNTNKQYMEQHIIDTKQYIEQHKKYIEQHKKTIHGTTHYRHKTIHRTTQKIYRTTQTNNT